MLSCLQHPPPPTPTLKTVGTDYVRPSPQIKITEDTNALPRYYVFPIPPLLSMMGDRSLSVYYDCPPGECETDLLLLLLFKSSSSLYPPRSSVDSPKLDWRLFIACLFTAPRRDRGGLLLFREEEKQKNSTRLHASVPAVGQTLSQP